MGVKNLYKVFIDTGGFIALINEGIPITKRLEHSIYL